VPDSPWGTFINEVPRNLPGLLTEECSASSRSSAAAPSSSPLGVTLPQDIAVFRLRRRCDDAPLVQVAMISSDSWGFPVISCTELCVRGHPLVLNH